MKSVSRSTTVSDLLAGFYLTRFRFGFRAAQDTILPEYKGSALRGALMKALRELQPLACFLKGYSCEGCLTNRSCAYGYLFKTSCDESINDREKYRYPPRPCIIEPPLKDGRCLKKGDIFTFDLNLVGDSDRFLPDLVKASQNIQLGRGRIVSGRRSSFGPEGKGRKSGNSSIPRDASMFSLERVDTIDTDDCLHGIYEKGLIHGSGERVSFDRLPPPSCTTGYVMLRFDTHMRNREAGLLQARFPPFQILIERLARKIQIMSRIYCGVFPPIPAQDLLDRAGKVRATTIGSFWKDPLRYSGRQKAKMNMGGVVGSVVYEGPVEEFLPLLKAGECIHVGSMTTMGLGKYRIV